MAMGWFAVGLLVGGALAAVVLLVRQQGLIAEAARVQGELEAARRNLDEQKAALTATRSDLRESFAALSQDALRDNRQDLLHDAGQLLKPVRETLEKVQAQLN